MNRLAMVAAGVFDGMTGSQITMLTVGVAGLAILLLSTRRRVRRSQQSSDISVRERYDELQRESSATRDVETVMRELDQLSRQIHGRLDTKLAKLEMVIRDADERIDRLSRMTRSAGGAETIDVTLKPETPSAAGPSSPEGLRSRYSAVYEAADEGLTPVEIAKELGRTPGEVELILSLRKTRRKSSYPVGAASSSQPTPDA